MATLIGMFRAEQLRERLLMRDSYALLVVAFDQGLVLVKASPKRDVAAAVFHRVTPLIGHHAGQARRLIRLGPKFGHVEERVADINPLTPDSLAEAFPSRVWRIWNDQISSAILRRRPGQLRINYRHDRYGDTVAWLTPHSEAGDVSRIMSAALGDRFTEATMSQGFVDAMLDRLPVI